MWVIECPRGGWNFTGIGAEILWKGWTTRGPNKLGRLKNYKWRRFFGFWIHEDVSNTEKGATLVGLGLVVKVWRVLDPVDSGRAGKI